MDKRKVIDAYLNGILTVQECAQILGINTTYVFDLMKDQQQAGNRLNRSIKPSLVKGLRFP